MSKVHVKTGDKVVVINGKDRGKQGKVLQVSPSEGKVIVEGVHMVTKHNKPRRQGEAGGIVKVEGAIYAGKVQLVCTNSSCEKYHKAIRAKVVFTEGKDGKKIKTRVCPKCGKEI